MSKWMPINTLPKEGSFLVYMPEERHKIQVMVKHPNVTIIGNVFSFDRSDPTHWMPLPTEPEKSDD